MYQVTARELQIINLISEGANNKEISVSLDIPINTVKAHIFNITKGFGMRSRTELAVIYLNNKSKFSVN
jgi:LuxR family transcriptional regulator, positive regulator of biofilm formation